ncbi:hypothetical protein EC5411_03656 [Escherichia coli 541-1]|nr:hypothetical protein EC5411_03656 [Escherichia coli 541-1]
MKFYMVEIMLSILISIFWMKQSGSNKHWKKINQESQYG